MSLWCLVVFLVTLLYIMLLPCYYMNALAASAISLGFSRADESWECAEGLILRLLGSGGWWLEG